MPLLASYTRCQATTRRRAQPTRDGLTVIDQVARGLQAPLRDTFVSSPHVTQIRARA